MKKIKFALLLGLLTNPNGEEEHENGRVVNRTRVVDITFLKALEHPELIMAMIEQLDRGFIEGESQMFISEVVYNNYLFRLVGTYDQWQAFFANKWEMLLHWGGDLMSHN
jgi:hypothetical protein